MSKGIHYNHTRSDVHLLLPLFLFFNEKNNNKNKNPPPSTDQVVLLYLR